MISIIIPCYNSEKIIENCLKGALNQSISEEFEVIVMDDGSKDHTKEIIQNLVGKDSRIHYFYQESDGWQAKSNYRNFQLFSREINYFETTLETNLFPSLTEGTIRP